MERGELPMMEALAAFFFSAAGAAAPKSA